MFDVKKRGLQCEGRDDRLAVPLTEEGLPMTFSERPCERPDHLIDAITEAIIYPSAGRRKNDESAFEGGWRHS